ncbi:MAG TPA: hypothetical protein VJ901_10140 [Thermoanaerobaculia bacterium]|nr:hypothetical protein [Thermoanaerobaculia bacterium]
MLPALFFAIVLPVQLPPASLAELACAHEIIATPFHEQHHVRRTTDATLPAPLAATIARNAADLQPPPLATNFFASSSTNTYPADAAGAVGPHHVVTAFNNGIKVFDRSGNRLANVTLSQFWTDPSIISGLYYDPRVLYDKVADRWFIAALYDNNLKSSTLVLGVSDTGDPSGTWARYRVSIGSSDLADFTRLGMSADRFVVTANSSALGSYLWSIRKTDAYSTIQSVQLVRNTNYDFMPVTIADNSTTSAYLLTNDTFGSATLWRLDEGASKPSVVNHYSSPPWTDLFNSEIGPQPSNQRMDVGDTTMQGAVGRAGVVWGVHMIESTTSPVHSSIRWWRIPLDGSAAETGTIDDPTAHTFYGFPSIAVNRLGGAMISYSLFNNDRFPTAAYSYRDPSGTMSATGVLKEGEAVAGVTRWGDFTSTVVDPANDLDFWSVQPYATPQLWSAWTGEITIAAPPARVRAVRH